MAQIKIAGTILESVVDGPGLRYTVFTQGCPHDCKGCHNPQTHDFKGGYLVNIDDLFVEMMSDPLIKGVTFSGGEPFEQSTPLAEFAAKVHSVDKDVIAYIGYIYEQLLNKSKENPSIMDLLKETEILIDGSFIFKQRNLE